MDHHRCAYLVRLHTWAEIYEVGANLTARDADVWARVGDALGKVDWCSGCGGTSCRGYCRVTVRSVSATKVSDAPWPHEVNTHMLKWVANEIDWVDEPPARGDVDLVIEWLAWELSGRAEDGDITRGLEAELAPIRDAVVALDGLPFIVPDMRVPSAFGYTATHPSGGAERKDGHEGRDVAIVWVSDSHAVHTFAVCVQWRRAADGTYESTAAHAHNGLGVPCGHAALEGALAHIPADMRQDAQLHWWRDKEEPPSPTPVLTLPPHPPSPSRKE